MQLAFPSQTEVQGRTCFAGAPFLRMCSKILADTKHDLFLHLSVSHLC